MALSESCVPPKKSARSAEASSLILLKAWNEWGEQAILEPTVQDGDAALRAHQVAIEHIEKQLSILEST